MAERITKEVTVTGVYEYLAPSFTGWGRPETRYIWKMEDSDGNIYVWKSGSSLHVKLFTDKYGQEYGEMCEKGDVITIRGSIKELSEYNGEPQTVLQRVTVLDRSFRAERPEERAERLSKEAEEKKKAQIESIGDGDRLFRMTYQNYKEHYDDCETLMGSYENPKKAGMPAFITVIVREGRLKASGVRGKRFAGYEFINENGGKVIYTAVSEENALERARKDYPEHTWELFCVRYKTDSRDIMEVEKPVNDDPEKAPAETPAGEPVDWNEIMDMLEEC